MAELVDALDSKSDQACLGASSSLVAGMNENLYYTIHFKRIWRVEAVTL